MGEILKQIFDAILKDQKGKVYAVFCTDMAEIEGELENTFHSTSNGIKTVLYRGVTLLLLPNQIAASKKYIIMPLGEPIITF